MDMELLEKLKARIDERRKWNMEHMKSPNLVNNGLVQALAIIDSIEEPDGTSLMGSSIMSYSRDGIHKIASNPDNLIISEKDEFSEALEPMGYPGDVVDVIYPDGVRELCVEESIANMIIDGMGKALFEKGVFTQEEYEDYLKDPYMDDKGTRIKENKREKLADVVPLFGGEAQ